MSVTLHEAAERRAEAAAQVNGPDKLGRNGRSQPPAGVHERELPPVPAEMRAATVQRDGKQYLRLDGYASVYEQPYEMYDMFGVYTEVVSAGAGSESLATGPDVSFLVNHRGLPLATTRAGTLELAEDDTGLRSVSYMNPKRQDAADLYAAIDDGDVREMSFAFRIVSGQWSPDYTEYRISVYDIDRGDTSAVTYGANPHTSISARAARFALTNNVMRAARLLGDDERELLREALGVARADVERDQAGRPALKVGERAARDLRLLRAHVFDGSDLDAAARTALTGVLDDVLEGTGRLAGQGPLSLLLGLHEPPEPAGTRTFLATSLDFVEAGLEAARAL
ncbi:MAG TPA: HK97 family phage prohead protease [Micromonosporaceae bacterium]|nr:HK97 family phage prohead protease [Micromonosporaceae bacterium]